MEEVNRNTTFTNSHQLLSTFINSHPRLPLFYGTEDKLLTGSEINLHTIVFPSDCSSSLRIVVIVFHTIFALLPSSFLLRRITNTSSINF